MGYSSGMRRFRIMIQNRKEQTTGKFGIDSRGVEWENTVCMWADVSWAKGKSGMREGSLDVYAVKMVRMSFTPQINERSRIVWNDKLYQIIPETFNADFQRNEIQFHMQLIVNEL